jgi:hypothetical protein
MRFINDCPSCGGHLAISVLKCGDCGVRVEGDIRLPRMAQLSPELLEFAEIYLMAGGSLKQVATELGVSYPTVRQKLDRVISTLTALREADLQGQAEILDRLERGEINAQEAARALRQISGPSAFKTSNNS